MPRCEDYPCCGHGPAPHGDGGGCPDARGRFRCVSCNRTMPAGHHSALCDRCRKPRTCRGCGEQSIAGSCGCYGE